MSGKVGRRDFNYLFGADESDDDILHEERDNPMNKDLQHVEPLEGQNKHSTENRRKSENSHQDSDNHKRCDSEVPENTYRKKTEEEQFHEKKRSCSIEDILKKRKKIKQDEESQIKDLNKSNITHLENEKIPQKNIVTSEQDKHSVENRKKQKLGKAEVGGLVVKLLMPAYIEKRFQSRDAFKTLARNISHALANKGK